MLSSFSNLEFRIQMTLRVPQALGEAYITFGKPFAAALGKKHTTSQLSAKTYLPSVLSRALGEALPSVDLALGKKKLTGWLHNGDGTLCRVLDGDTLDKKRPLC